MMIVIKIVKMLLFVLVFIFTNSYIAIASGYYEEQENFRPGIYEAKVNAKVYYDLSGDSFHPTHRIKKGTRVSVYSAGKNSTRKPSVAWFNLSDGRECNPDTLPWGDIAWIGVHATDFKRVDSLPEPVFKSGRISNCVQTDNRSATTVKQASSNIPSPSFDCLKAGSKTEEAICANENLAQLDKHLAKVWKNLLLKFDEKPYKNQLKKEQSLWIKQREKCINDIQCIEKTYQKRIDLLSGRQAERQFAGQFEVAKEGVGRITIYPTENGLYFVRIQTMEPLEAKWVCDLTAKATAKDSILTIEVDHKSFPAFLEVPGMLEIPAIKEVFSASNDYCGWNGNIAYEYLRVPLDR